MNFSYKRLVGLLSVLTIAVFATPHVFAEYLDLSDLDEPLIVPEDEQICECTQHSNESYRDIYFSSVHTMNSDSIDYAINVYELAQEECDELAQEEHNTSPDSSLACEATNVVIFSPNFFKTDCSCDVIHTYRQNTSLALTCSDLGSGQEDIGDGDFVSCINISHPNP